MTKLGSRKLHICPKVTKMESITGHRMDYNEVGAVRGSDTYPAKINSSTPPPPWVQTWWMWTLFSAKQVTLFWVVGFVYILPTICLLSILWFFHHLQQNKKDSFCFLLFCTDDLPMRGFIGHLEESGFLPHSHKVFLWAHLNFNIEFNGDQVHVFETKTKLI